MNAKFAIVALAGVFVSAASLATTVSAQTPTPMPRPAQPSFAAPAIATPPTMRMSPSGKAPPVLRVVPVAVAQPAVKTTPKVAVKRTPAVRVAAAKPAPVRRGPGLRVAAADYRAPDAATERCLALTCGRTVIMGVGF